jgi:two-component system, cell cycle response regulator
VKGGIGLTVLDRRVTMEQPIKAKARDGREILIIEDSPTQAAKLRYLLEKHGFSVTIACNAAEAFSLLAVRVPSLVISDVIMPEMDGFAVCSMIRGTESTRNLPVILLTSLSDPLDVIKGLKCGADNLITKPWDEPRLMSRIDYIFANLDTRNREQTQFVGEVILAGEKHFIQSDPVRMISYLFYSYETATLKNQELMEAQEELRHLSTHDILTGLYNRTFFEEELKRLSLGRQFPVSLLAADVDGLKLVNDSLGHEAGDRLLRLAAEVLSGAFRAGDVVARVGGDEFAVLLPQADPAVVGESITRIRRRLEEINGAEGEFSLSISIGAATAQSPGQFQDALKASDERMYLEKFARKGKVRGRLR